LQSALPRSAFQLARISRLDYEIKFKTYGVDKAAVRAMEAAIKVNETEVKRLTDLQAIEKIVAPFPGVITARHIDPGDLVSADSRAPGAVPPDSGGHRPRATRLWFSSDGKTVAAGDGTNDVTLYDAATGAAKGEVSQ
jgi:hypothetical protein